jgi:hypothetical protein
MTTDAPVIKELIIPEEAPRPVESPIRKPVPEPVKKSA